MSDIHSHFTRHRVAAAIVAVIAAASCPPAVAQSAIKVLVNEQPITTYDIRNRAGLLKLTSGGRATNEQATEELIEERLKMQEAARRGVSISDAQVDAAFGQIAQRAKMSPSQLSQALNRSGINPQTLRNRLSSEIAWSQIVRSRFRETVHISERDVADALLKGQSNDQETTKMAQFDLQPIIFVVPSNASQGIDAQRRREAEAFRSRFGGCDQALEDAKKLTGVVVKPKVRRTADDLRGAVAENIQATEVGSATRPQKIDEGYQLYGVCAKRDLEGKIAAEEEARDKLTNELGSRMARRFLRDLRAQAIIEYR